MSLSIPVLMPLLARLRAPLTSPFAAAVAAAAVVGLACLALGPLPGISGEEAAFLAPLARDAQPAPSAAPRGPSLAGLVAKTAIVTAGPFGPGPVAAARLTAAGAAALLAGAVAWLTGTLAGPVAALLAPALLLTAPRLLAPFLHAGPRPMGAALLFLAALAYWRSAAARTALGRVRNGAYAGVLFGLAVAVQLEAALLLPVLAAHAALVRLLRHLRPSPDDPAPGEPPAPIEASLRGVPVAVAALLVIGPAVVFALWPWLWPDPVHRLAAAVRLFPSPSVAWATAPHRATTGLLAWSAPATLTALALPAALVGAGVVGLLHGAFRLWRALRGDPGLSDELFLLLGALWPFAAAALGIAGRGSIPGPWLAAFPFLAVLAARAVVAAAGAAWPARATPIAATTGALVVLAGAVATLHAWPEPGAAWGELAGGAPGAASAGLERQDGEAAGALISAASDRARPGARVYLPDAVALALYRAGRHLRADLVPVATPEEADLALVPVAAAARAAEYRVWSAFGTATPVDGVFLDEVPLGWVYARPGAWR